MPFGWKDAASWAFNPIWQAQSEIGTGKSLYEHGEKVPGLVDDYLNSLDRTQNEFREVDPQGELGYQGREAHWQAGKGFEGYQNTGRGMNRQMDMLENRAQGRDSLSAEQLRQGLGSLLSQQRSMAAGASPRNSAMAARTAATQMGRMSSGMAGQQAMAGIAERHAAQQALGQMLEAKRRQDADMAIRSRQQALGAYGNIEAERGRRFGVVSGQPTKSERLTSMFSDAIPVVGDLDKAIKGRERQASKPYGTGLLPFE